MSIWQTQSWQEMLIASGQSEEYFMIERNISLDSLSESEELDEENIVFIEKRKVSFGEYGLFVIGVEGELDEDFLQGLTELCQEEKCLFVQVETLDYLGAPFSSKGERIQDRGFGRENSSESFCLGYYKKFIPPCTVVIDLTKSEEEILAQMKQKGRYNIKLADKKGVVIEQVEKNSRNIEIFHTLMSATTERNSFAGNTKVYYETFLREIPNSELTFAYYEQKVIAAGIFVYQDDIAIYYYGASDNDYRKVMAPYLLQFRAIQTAQKRGCKMYDFLGVAGPDEKNSSLSGVTDFKLKLSLDRREVSSSYIFVNKKIKYTLIQILKKIKE